MPMGNKPKKTPTEKIQLLGKLQLGSYLVILIWLVVVELLAIQQTGNFGQNGWPVIWIIFAIPGLLLIPSSLIFIKTGKWSRGPSNLTARILQIILFVLVLALTYPALILASFAIDPFQPSRELDSRIFTRLLSPSFLVACVLGIVSFPLMWLATKPFMRKKSNGNLDANQNLIKQ